jgi:hypothetical protein
VYEANHSLTWLSFYSNKKLKLKKSGGFTTQVPMLLFIIIIIIIIGSCTPGGTWTHNLIPPPFYKGSTIWTKAHWCKSTCSSDKFRQNSSKEKNTQWERVKWILIETQILGANLVDSKYPQFHMEFSIIFLW